ncbi:hypothetical protein MXD81_18520, partial [Microbacteriaceae bacterium K1510]|nr:hypothetical protein [Microbacteriaceae bacterium K1510]
SLLIIHDGAIVGVCRQTGKEEPVITINSQLPLTIVSQHVSERAPALPSVVTVDEHGDPVGFVPIETLFASIVTVSRNQAVLLHTLLDTMSEATT